MIMDGDGFTREVSIIIPVFNEEENINPMIQEIQEAMEDADYEILFVDDGSNDRTFEMITQAKSKEDKVRVVKHHRNMGKAIALATGFFHASGRISITMDGDLQDDPKEIPRFIAAFEDGFNLICGWRAKRQDNASKRWPSKVYNTLVRRMSGINIHDMNCGFKAYDTR
ncbi:MAG: glycosyltransferase family 2 protein, partial [Candidatus Poseidoniaceae archaeon]